MNIKNTKIVSKYRALGVEAKAGLWFIICNFLNKGISVIIVPIYTRLLSSEEYGKYTVFQSWLNIFIILATLEISRGHYKLGVIKYENDVKRYASSTLGLGSTITFAFLLVYICGVSYFNQLLELSTPVIIGMLLYLMVYPAWEFWTIDQRFKYKYKRMVLITLLVAILTPIVGMLGILLLNMEGEAAIFSKLLIQGAVAFFLYVAYVRNGRKLWDKKYWKEVFVFNITLVPYLLSTTILNQADRIMINNMIGASQAAIYGVAYSAAMLFQLFNTAISDAFVPWMYRRLKEESYDKIEPINDKLLILVGALNLMLVLFSPEVIRVFAPAAYYEAIWIIPPVTASVFFIFLFTRYINAEIYYEATKEISIISILIALINIVLNYFCILQWGYLAAGYTTLVCYILFCLAHFYTLRRICKRKCSGKQIFTGRRTVVISIIFLGLVFTIMTVYEYRLIRYCVAFALFAYCIIKRDFVVWLLKNKKADN